MEPGTPGVEGGTGGMLKECYIDIAQPEEGTGSPEGSGTNVVESPLHLTGASFDLRLTSIGTETLPDFPCVEDSPVEDLEALMVDMGVAAASRELCAAIQQMDQLNLAAPPSLQPPQKPCSLALTNPIQVAPGTSSTQTEEAMPGTTLMEESCQTRTTLLPDNEARDTSSSEPLAAPCNSPVVAGVGRKEGVGEEQSMGGRWGSDEELTPIVSEEEADAPDSSANVTPKNSPANWDPLSELIESAALLDPQFLVDSYSLLAIHRQKHRKESDLITSMHQANLCRQEDLMQLASNPDLSTRGKADGIPGRLSLSMHGVLNKSSDRNIGGPMAAIPERSLHLSNVSRMEVKPEVDMAQRYCPRLLISGRCCNVTGQALCIHMQGFNPEYLLTSSCAQILLIFFQI